MYETKKNDRFCNRNFIVKDLFKEDTIFYRRSVPYGKNCIIGKNKF